MPVDYDVVAPTYDERYRGGGPAGVGEALRQWVAGAERLLEVGCGTGHWLAEIAPRVGLACGLDFSAGMLAKARQATGAALLQGDACALPFAPDSFDAVLCINALHHFSDARAFVGEGFRVLRTGGRMAVIGMDPSAGGDRWYLYDYFPGTLEADQRRYPAAAAIAARMAESGFAAVSSRVAARLAGVSRGREVYADPILSRHGTSQLTLLSDSEFEAGMRRIDAAIIAAEERATPLDFVTDISLALVTAGKA